MSTVSEVIDGPSGAAKGAIVPVRLAHFVIRTKKVSELVEWYKFVFEAHVVVEGKGFAFLTFDDEHHRLAVAEFDNIDDPTPNFSGIDHVAFSYASIGDLLNTYRRLKDRGIEPFFRVDHGPTTSLYYKDPDGNQIELQVDNFSNPEDATAYFRSAAFASNPIGVEIDPDDLLARFDAGENPESLLSSGTRPSA